MNSQTEAERAFITAVLEYLRIGGNAGDFWIDCMPNDLVQAMHYVLKDFNLTKAVQVSK